MAVVLEDDTMEKIIEKLRYSTPSSRNIYVTNTKKQLIGIIPAKEIINAAAVKQGITHGKHFLISKLYNYNLQI